VLNIYYLILNKTGCFGVSILNDNFKNTVMKKLAYTFVMQFIIAFFLTAALSAQEYMASVESSTVKWEGKKVVAGGHYGTIDIKSGEFKFTDGMLTAAEVVMDMSTIVSDDLTGGSKERLEGHLKSDDFFGVDKFAESGFVMESALKAEGDMLKISGQMTIKGKTNPQSFTARIDMSNNTIEGKMEIDRSLYDVRFGSGKFFDNLGDKAINDIFTLEFTIKLEDN
jgi:polyisoprenoid-binding protein YceI